MCKVCFWGKGGGEVGVGCVGRLGIGFVCTCWAGKGREHGKIMEVWGGEQSNGAGNKKRGIQK